EGNLYVADPTAASAPRNVSKVTGAAVQLHGLSESNPDLAYIGVTDRDRAWPDLYSLSPSTGARTLVRRNTQHTASCVFYTTGEWRLATRVAEGGDQVILRVDRDEFLPVYSCNIFESCSVLRFHKDGKRVYIETNHAESSDRSELALLNPANGKMEI